MIGSPEKDATIICLALRRKSGEEFDWMLCDGPQTGKWIHQWSLNCLAAEGAAKDFLIAQQRDNGGELVTFDLACSQRPYAV
jgi:hypothetical protein